MEEEGEEGEEEGEKGDWGGGGTAHREAINLSLQVSPGMDLPPSSSRSLLTGFNSLEAIETRVSAPCWSLTSVSCSMGLSITRQLASLEQSGERTSHNL